jgi:hypothetical protein
MDGKQQLDMPRPELLEAYSVHQLVIFSQRFRVLKFLQLWVSLQTFMLIPMLFDRFSVLRQDSTPYMDETYNTYRKLYRRREVANRERSQVEKFVINDELIRTYYSCLHICTSLRV